MHLAPREIDKLVLHGAGTLAQKRLARGVKLNVPEAIALGASLEVMARDAAKMRQGGPVIFARANEGTGIDAIAAHVLHAREHALDVTA
jgi:urease subunit gamma/beta